VNPTFDPRLLTVYAEIASAICALLVPTRNTHSLHADPVIGTSATREVDDLGLGGEFVGCDAAELEMTPTINSASSCWKNRCASSFARRLPSPYRQSPI
jgi:hypothetical protein